MADTTDIQRFVRNILLSNEALRTDPHAIDAAFQLIADDVNLRSQYDALLEKFGRDVLNQDVGKYVAEQIGRTGKTSTKSSQTSLTGTYTILDKTKSTAPAKKWVQSMITAYARDHKAAIDPIILEKRDDVADIALHDGVSIEDAIAAVLERENKH